MHHICVLVFVWLQWTPIIQYLKGDSLSPTERSTPLFTTPSPHAQSHHASIGEGAIIADPSNPNKAHVNIPTGKDEPAMVLDRTADLMDDGLTLQKPTRESYLNTEDDIRTYNLPLDLHQVSSVLMVSYSR